MDYFKFLETVTGSIHFRVRFKKASIAPGYEYWMKGLVKPRTLPEKAEVWSCVYGTWLPNKLPIEEWELSLYRWPVTGAAPLPSLEES